MMSVSTDDITVAKLDIALPGIFTSIASNPVLCDRLKVEALYEAATIEQQEEIMEVRRDEALRIPGHIDYTA